MHEIVFYFAYTILSGFGSAPSYSLNETSILDVSFLHQRGTLIGLYCLVTQFSNLLPQLPLAPSLMPRDGAGASAIS